MSNHPKPHDPALIDQYVKSEMHRVWSRLQDGPVPPLHPEMGPCLLWTGEHTGEGYAQVVLTSSKRGPRACVHRLIWIEAHGPIVHPLEIHHACEVTGCARLAHLRCVTHRENMLATPHNVAAQCAIKTHCKQNHPFSPENTRIANTGQRVCVTCHREAVRRHDAKRRAK